MQEDIISRESLDRPLYRGLSNESDEELYTLMWLFELFDYGFIEEIKRAESFRLSSKVQVHYKKEVKLQTKIRLDNKVDLALDEHFYTPEYKVTWNQNIPLEINKLLREKIIGNLMIEKTIKNRLITWNGSCYIEAKPSFDQNNMTREFKINQKWIYQKYGIFINLIIPEIWFQKTFTPKEYLLTPISKKKRKLNWQPRTLSEFLNSNENENDKQNNKRRNTAIL